MPCGIPILASNMSQGLMMSRPELVIFDWDGTLMDSVGQIVASLLYAAARYDLPLTADAAANIIGLGLPEAMAVLFPDHPHLRDPIQAVYAQHYVAHSQTGTGLFAGIEPLLVGLHERGVRLAVATGKSRAGLDRVLAQSGMAARFDVTRCAGETTSKPDPHMLQEIMQVTGLTPQQCVMVGDSIYDLEMAQRMGMPSVGVTYGVHQAHQLKAYQPVALVDTVAQLAAWLDEYSQPTRR
jgi:phosphoglycolate phosphatase